MEGREGGGSIEVQRVTTVKGKGLDHTTSVSREKFTAVIQWVNQGDEDMVQ